MIFVFFFFLQREESMKRLLEWKQRMLQSPLTRKSVGSGCRDDAKNELFKNKIKSSVDDSSYQISSASPVSSLSDKPQDSLNELNGHEEVLQRSRDFPIKTTQMCDNYDRRIQNFGPPVREAQAPYIHNNGKEYNSIFIKHVTYYQCPRFRF